MVDRPGELERRVEELAAKLAERDGTIEEQKRTIESQQHQIARLERKVQLQEGLIIDYVDISKRQTQEIPDWLRQDVAHAEKRNEVRVARARFYDAMHEVVLAEEQFKRKENPTPEETEAYRAEKRKLEMRYRTRLAAVQGKENELADTPAHTPERGQEQEHEQDP